MAIPNHSSAVGALQIEECLLDSSRLLIHLSGLLNDNSIEACYAQDSFGPHTFKIVRRAWPNNYAMLDILYVNEEPAGTIFSLKHSADLLHMVGMFLKEDYRSASFHRDEMDGPSPAAYFIDQYKHNLFAGSQSMTLEVMNYNLPAIKLYEQSFIHQGRSYNGFCLLGRQEVAHYARLRRKKIGHWHKLNDEELFNWGVQWRHIPNFNNQPTWSITRVYLFKPNDGNLEHIDYQGSLFSRITFSIKLAFSFIRYGSIINGMRFKFVQLFQS